MAMTTATQAVTRRAADLATTTWAILRGQGLWVLLLAAILLAVTGNAYLETLSAEALILGIAALGFNIILGDTGTFSLAGATAFGAGAYTFALLLTHGWDIWLALLGTIVLSTVISALIGVITLRLRSAYLAIATFAIAEIVLNLTSELSFTGGFAGLVVPAVDVAGHVFDDAISSYVLIVVVLIVAVLVHRYMAISQLGRQFNAVRDNELAASALGLGIFRTRLISLLIGGVFAAVAGVLYCLVIPYLDPSILSADESVLILVMLVVGGMGTTVGPVLGAIILTAIPQAFQALQLWWQLIYGAVITLAVLAGNAGLVGTGQAAYRKLRELLSRRAGPASAGRPDGPGQAVAGAGRSLDFPVQARTDLSMLEVASLTKRFGGLAAVNAVSLVCRPGTVHALIGPNGAGKSTFVNLLSGVYRPDTGTIRLGDRDLVGLAPHQIARLGLVRTFQAPHPFGEMTVHDNIMVAIERQGHRGAAARTLASQYLTAAGLGDVADSPAESVPHGQQRLMELARVLALQPKILILDEPTGGLSENDVTGLGAVLRALADQGMGVLVIEHNMAFVMGNADTVSVLNAGRLIAEGSASQVAANADVRAAYLGEFGSGIDLGVSVGPGAGDGGMAGPDGPGSR
jgi:ABC-type branched-subunit amino acid transport system ATPase component/ABC-type branched-subunit amino acid transport system permease subunit